MLRDEKRKGTDLGTKAEEYTSIGKLLPDEFIVGLVRRWLSEHDSEFVFDGFPRSVGQADALAHLLEERATPLDVVIALQADAVTLHQRITSRVMCSACGRIFSVGLHVSSLADACPHCGGRLTRRSDDTAETLERRLIEYREKTEPLLSYYQRAGLLVIVDSSGSPDLVFQSVRTALEKP
jgi:adenylate kinase